MPDFTTRPFSHISAALRPPSSKSITNRLLLIAALAEGTSCLKAPLFSRDTEVMISALQQLGVSIEHRSAGIDGEDSLRITGCGGRFAASPAPLYIENAGTAARFLTVALLLGQGEYRLDGNARMRERPIADLLDALPNPAAITASAVKGYLPLSISALGFAGGKIRIPAHNSSQYISALMLSAPYAQRDLEIEIVGQLVSRPYVAMTAALMRSFGVEVEYDEQQPFIRVPCGQVYQAQDISIEADASSASYFFALAAATAGEVEVGGVHKNMLQGDIAFVDILEQMGCQVSQTEQGLRLRRTGALRGVEVNMKDISDTAPTLAALALFAEGETIIYGVENMRLKETDRIRALYQEFQKIGAVIEENPDGLKITGQQAYRGASLATYDDHRMAMSFSIIASQVPDIRIEDPDCVSKTFPNYFDLYHKIASTAQ